MSPAKQLRVELSRARVAGRAFDEAWPAAVERALAGAMRAEEWDVALAWARPAFESAYARRGAVRLYERCRPWSSQR